jgi:hypothetical protein
MNIKSALKGQYHAGLAMLRQCVERCPADLWTSGTHPRTYWRIAYHAVFFADFYMVQNEEAFTPWARHREDVDCLWETPPVVEPYTQDEMLEYIDLLVARVDETVDGLDLDSPETGFPWYKSMGKLDHELMNVRHLQGHIGQLSELLMAQGVDTDWIGKLKG